MSDVISQVKDDKIESKLREDFSKDELEKERAKMVTFDFMEKLKEKDRELYDALNAAFRLERDEEKNAFKLVEEDKGYKARLDSYFDGLEQAASQQAFLNIFQGRSIPAEHIAFSFDTNNQVSSVRLTGVEPTVLIEKISGGEEWKLVNFDITFDSSTYSAWLKASTTAATLYQVLKDFNPGNSFPEKSEDTENPFIASNGKLAWAIPWGTDKVYGTLPDHKSSKTFVEKINDLYWKKRLSQPVSEPAETEADDAPSDVPAAPGATGNAGKQAEGGEGTEEAPADTPEATGNLEAITSRAQNELIEMTTAGGYIPLVEGLDRQLNQVIKDNNPKSIKHVCDQIHTEWSNMFPERATAEATASASTNSQTAEAGADSGAGIDSHEAFREALKNNPRDYFLELPRVNPDGTSEKVVSLHLQNAESVKYSTVQDFLGKEGEAAIGLSEDKLKKTTVTLIEPGEVSRAGHVGQTAGTPYTWNGETWVDKDGDRLKVYWNTKFSYKTAEAETPAATEPPAATTEPVAE